MLVKMLNGTQQGSRQKGKNFQVTLTRFIKRAYKSLFPYFHYFYPLLFQTFQHSNGDDESSGLSVSTRNSLYRDPEANRSCGMLRDISFESSTWQLREELLLIRVKNFNVLSPHQLIGEAYVKLDFQEKYGYMSDAIGIDTQFQVDITSDANLEIKGEIMGLVVLYVRVDSCDEGVSEPNDKERDISYLGKPRYNSKMAILPSVNAPGVLNISKGDRNMISNYISTRYMPWRYLK